MANTSYGILISDDGLSYYQFGTEMLEQGSGSKLAVVFSRKVDISG